MGSRVTRKRQPKRSKSSSSKDALFYPPKILLLFTEFLRFLGHPFYLLLTFILTLVFNITWDLGEMILKDGYKFIDKIVGVKLKIPQILIRVILFFLPSLFLSGLIWIWVLKDLPKPGVLATRDQVVSTKIYDRNGTLLFKIYRNQNRTLVPLSDIPTEVRQATIAIEDADFYSHPGFSIRGITRAFLKNTTQGEMTGGSTITQQLIKNTLLSSEKTLTRKIKELVLATQVELNFSKDQILEMYFNEVGYGGATYGIEEAGEYYFGKSVRNLNLAETALLAGLPKAPTTYSPFGTNPQLAKQRQLEVLERMVEQGYITSDVAQEAGEAELKFTNRMTDIKAPHFVMYVKQLLVDRYGERVVEEGGLEVTTSLDLNLQNMAEKIVQEEIQKIKHLGISNGAALITNPKNGEVLAMVGAKDYFDQKGDGNYNVTTALRQPGSSIKPVNYSYALEHKIYSAASLLSDSPVTYSIAGSPPYSPRNYDSTYRGNVPLRTALASSLNIPAVKTLATYGVSNMITHATKMGITTWNDPKRYGLSLTLGGGEVKMTDMNVVYGVFANKGKRTDLLPILKVTNYRGQTLEDGNCAGTIPSFVSQVHAAEAGAHECGREVLNPQVAFIITNILSDNNARSPVFGSRSKLVIPGHPEVAVKTGTTQNLRDNWAIGFTQDYVVTTWVGNNNNKPMSYVASGVTGATPIWQKIMIELTKNKPSLPWEEPQGLLKVAICPRTGTLPCQGCPGSKTEYFLPGTEPKAMCIFKPEATPEAQVN